MTLNTLGTSPIENSKIEKNPSVPQNTTNALSTLKIQIDADVFIKTALEKLDNSTALDQQLKSIDGENSKQALLEYIDEYKDKMVQTGNPRYHMKQRQLNTLENKIKALTFAEETPISAITYPINHTPISPNAIIAPLNNATPPKKDDDTKNNQELKQEEKSANIDESLASNLTTILGGERTTSTVQKNAVRLLQELQNAPKFSEVKIALENLGISKNITAFQLAIGADPIDGWIGSGTIMALLTKAGIDKTNDLFQIFDARKKSGLEVKMSENANKSNEDGSNEKKPPVEKNPKAQESSKEKPKTKEPTKTEDEKDIENLNENITVKTTGLSGEIDIGDFKKGDETGYIDFEITQTLSDDKYDYCFITLEKKELLSNKDFTKELLAQNINGIIYGVTISRKQNSTELNIHFTKNIGMINYGTGEYYGGINDKGERHGEGTRRMYGGETWIGEWKDGKFQNGKKENNKGETISIYKNGGVVCSGVNECDAFTKTEQIDTYLSGRGYTKDPEFSRSYFNRDKDLWIYVDSNNKVHAERLGLRQYNPFALINDQEKLHTLEVAQILATKRIKNKTN